MKIDIDEALRAYVDRPAPFGMEARILSRVRRRRAWHWPVLGLVAAGLSCVVLFRPAPDRVVTVAAPQGTRGGSRVLPGAGQRGFRRVSRVLRRSPDTVDTLYRFAQEHPEEAIQLTVEHEPTPIAPLTFEPIVIDELEKTQQ